MAGYAIIRHRKRKGPEQINGVWAENTRAISGKNVDRTRSSQNITLTPLQYTNYDHYVKSRREQIRVANSKRQKGEKKARMPRVTTDKKTGEQKHPALMQEFVFTHSNGVMNTDESIRYCKLADTFIREWFPDNEILLSVAHLDETTPHIHIWVDYYSKSQNRYIQAELQAAGKTDLDTIREAWQKRLEEEGFELLKQDGSVVGARHDGEKADIKKGEVKKLQQKVEKLEEIAFTGARVRIKTKRGVRSRKQTWKEKAIALEKKVEQLQNREPEIRTVEKVVEKEIIVPEVRVMEKVVEKEIIVPDPASKEKDAQIASLKEEKGALEKKVEQLQNIVEKWGTYIKEALGLDVKTDTPPAAVQPTLTEAEEDYTKLEQPNPFMM